ncbi:MAG: thioredoxin [Clostridia bacterium]|nr:thioredoxin [Clostridia bacterium]
MTVLTTENFDSVISENKKVIVDFWASWCAPCKMLMPIMEKLAEDYADKAVFCKVNIDEQGELAQRFGVMSIPTVIAFVDGQPAAKSVGVKNAKALAADLNLE